MDHSPHDLFVAPGGDDAAAGTREAPLASLQRARDLLRDRPAADRAAHGPVAVWVRGGDYLLPAGLRLTAEDSGTPDAPVTWRACPGERVRLIGGVRVDGFEPWRDEILQTDLAGPLTAAGMDEIPPHLPKRYQVDPDAAPESCELYLDGERQTTARWPNARREPGKAGRWAYVAGVRDDLDWLLEPSGSVFNAGSDRIRAWQHNPEDIQVHVFTNPNWADDVLNLDHVDAGMGELWLHPSSPGGGHAHFETGGRFYVKHVLEELDEPGEYYIDRPARRLYFWPPRGSAGGLAVVTTAENVIVTDGASHLTVRDFAIQSARGCAVVIRGGSHVTVAGGTISGAGAWGVLVSGGRNHRVRGCDLFDLGRGGVYLRGGDRFTLERSDHLVHNCEIQRYGRINICYQAGIKLHGVGNGATNCHIHHAGHFGAVIHEGCDNTIERCEIDDVCLEAADAGGIYLYTNWDKGLGNLTMWGNAVRHCLIHDIAGYGMHRPYGLQQRGQFEAYYVTPYACWGIYMDDFASGATISGNIFYRCPLGAIELGGGRGNVIENNIIVDCIPAIHMSSRWHAANHSYPAAGRDALEYVGWDRPPYRDRFPMLEVYADIDQESMRIPKHNTFRRNVVAYAHDSFKGYWQAVHEEGCAVAWQFDEYDIFTFACDHNLFWHDGKEVRVEVRIAADRRLDTMSLERWQLRGFDEHSLVADPGFADAEHDRYELRADSPAFALGFEPIPVDRIGLLADEYRPSVPARSARERRELLFAKTLLPLPRSVSFGTETGLQLQALRERRRRGDVTSGR